MLCNEWGNGTMFAGYLQSYQCFIVVATVSNIQLPAQRDTVTGIVMNILILYLREYSHTVVQTQPVKLCDALQQCCVGAAQTNADCKQTLI